MKATILEMRRNGVARPKWELQRAMPIRGTLEVLDTRENSYNRIIKLARLVEGGTIQKILYEVHLLWMNGDKLCLTGFERQETDGQLVDYAQSWICVTGEPERTVDNANLMPRTADFRL